MLKCSCFLFAQTESLNGQEGIVFVLPFHHSIMVSYKIPRAFKLQQNVNHFKYEK